MEHSTAWQACKHCKSEYFLIYGINIALLNNTIIKFILNIYTYIFIYLQYIDTWQGIHFTVIVTSTGLLIGCPWILLKHQEQDVKDLKECIKRNLAPSVLSNLNATVIKIAFFKNRTHNNIHNMKLTNIVNILLFVTFVYM